MDKQNNSIELWAVLGISTPQNNFLALKMGRVQVDYMILVRAPSIGASVSCMEETP